MHETQGARAANAAVARLAASVVQDIDGNTDGNLQEAQARRLARSVALLLQAAQLQTLSSEDVFDAFCASRIASAADVFGLLPAGVNLDALLARAMPQL